MTVGTAVPIVEYNGNGTITKFDWSWDMIEDSSINVLVNSQQADGWIVEGDSVIFDTAPADGSFIQIYRLTKIWMPEDYVAFGRFHPEKTELSVDRATLIMQERQGTATGAAPPNGIVGGANLSIEREEYTITVISDRGTDAVIPMYIPDGEDPPEPVDPDPSIIWSGAAISLNTFGEGANGHSAIINIALDGSAYYPVNNTQESVPWVNIDPSDGDYWMRVSVVSSDRPVIIGDGSTPRPTGQAFPIAGAPYVSIDTFGESPPQTVNATIIIEISKDAGGKPDGGWASRVVNLEVRFNLEEVTEPPVTPLPDTPDGVAATDGSHTDKVAVTWNESVGAASYEVWRHTSNNTNFASRIAGASTNSYNDTSAVVSQTYYYWIKAYNSAGITGFSAVDSGYRAAAPPAIPAAAAGVSATDGVHTNKVRVTWSASSGATSYEVWRHTSNVSGSASKIADSAGTTYDDYNAVAPTVYYYWIKAVNTAGTSGFSASDSGYRADTVQPPTPPAGTVSWLAFFGAEFGATLPDIYDVMKRIAAQGVAIRFTVPNTATRIKVKFTTIEIATIEVSRTGSVNTTALDFDTPPTYVWGLGGGITGWINPDPGDLANATHMELVPGRSYIFNLKNNTIPSANWVHPQVTYRLP